MKMVWKKVRKYTEEEAEHISKRAKTVKASSRLFSKTVTRKAVEVNEAKNCKQTVTKKQTRNLYL